MICSYFKIPENFVHLNLPDGFMIVYIPLVSNVKFQFIIAFLPNGSPSQPNRVKPYSFGRSFAEFADHVINRFVSTITTSLAWLLVWNIACLLFEFFHTDDFSWEFEWQQVSSILQDYSQYLNNAVVWIVSPYLFISKSSSLFTNPLGIIPSLPTTVDIPVTFVIHCFFLTL